jgi:hypothetical protein
MVVAGAEKPMTTVLRPPHYGAILEAGDEGAGTTSPHGVPDPEVDVSVSFDIQLNQCILFLTEVQQYISGSTRDMERKVQL